MRHAYFVEMIRNLVEHRITIRWTEAGTVAQTRGMWLRPIVSRSNTSSRLAARSTYPLSRLNPIVGFHEALAYFQKNILSKALSS